MMETLTIGCIEIFLSSHRGKICRIALDNHGVFGVCTFAHDLPDGQFLQRGMGHEPTLVPRSITAPRVYDRRTLFRPLMSTGRACPGVEKLNDAWPHTGCTS